MLLCCVRFPLRARANGAHEARSDTRWRAISVCVKKATFASSKPGSAYCAVAYVTPGCVNRSQASVTGSSATSFKEASKSAVEWNETLSLVCPALTSSLSQQMAVVIDVWRRSASGEAMVLVGTHRVDASGETSGEEANIAPGATLLASISQATSAKAGVPKSYAVEIIRAHNLQFARKSLHVEIHVGGEKKFQTPECVNGAKTQSGSNPSTDALAALTVQ